MFNPQSPKIIPQNQIGVPINVSTITPSTPAGYTLSEGQVLVAIFEQSAGGANTNPQSKQITVPFTPGNVYGTYTTIGGEFADIPGLCDAQIMVYAVSGDTLTQLLYSVIIPQYVLFQPPKGVPIL